MRPTRHFIAPTFQVFKPRLFDKCSNTNTVDLDPKMDNPLTMALPTLAVVLRNLALIIALIIMKMKTLARPY